MHLISVVVRIIGGLHEVGTPTSFRVSAFMCHLCRPNAAYSAQLRAVQIKFTKRYVSASKYMYNTLYVNNPPNRASLKCSSAWCSWSCCRVPCHALSCQLCSCVWLSDSALSQACFSVLYSCFIYIVVCPCH